MAVRIMTWDAVAINHQREEYSQFKAEAGKIAAEAYEQIK